MRTWPDHGEPKIAKRGSAKGSIVNYFPPKTSKGMARAILHAFKADKQRRKGLGKRELRRISSELIANIKADRSARKEWTKQRRGGLKMLGWKPKPLTQAQKLKAIKADMRRRGYHPAPRYGAGEWVHRRDCTMRTLKLDATLGWFWVPSVNWTLLCRSVRRDVAARQ